MKVIVQGTNNRVTCKDGCGSVLEFTPSDITLRHRPIQVGHHEIECMPEPEDHYQAQVSCPVCHKALPVPASRILKRQLLTSLQNQHY